MYFLNLKETKFSKSDVVLPISLLPFEDESGLGYCLRAIAQNGANLHSLRKLLDIQPLKQITSTNAPVLSRLFGCDKDWLEKLLPSAERTKPYRRDFNGHRWYSRNHLRMQRPQICSRCIHTNGYCKAIWEVSMGLVCIEHSCLLIDSCTKCKQPLRWDRPRIDVGHCGHILTTPADFEIPTTLINLQLHIEKKFNAAHDSEIKTDNKSSSFLDRLSLSGLHAFITAFGAKSRPYETTPTSIRSQVFRCEQWFEIICRGLDRIEKSELGLISNDELSHLIVESMLIKLVHNHEPTTDQRLAIELLSKFFDRKVTSNFYGKLRHLSQLELFDEVPS
jgi:hypothetical protein